MHLIEGLPDDQVETLLAEARRLAADRPNNDWLPAFFGVIKDGPTNGSSPEYIDSVLSQGFGSDR